MGGAFTLLARIGMPAGMREKLTDVQDELIQARLVRAFFYGLRLGAALLEY